MTETAQTTLRVAVMQATGLVNSPAENLRRLAFRAGEAVAKGAGLLVTPELFTAGYAPTLVHGTDGTAQRDQLAAIAAEHSIALVASTVEHSAGNRYITASFFGPGGEERTRYRKQHLFGPDENAVFTPGGEAPEIIEYAGFKTALGICFDVEFPEFTRAAALAGAELLCVPTAVPLRAAGNTGDHPLDTRLIPSMVVPTRALESQLYVAYANHSGPRFAGVSTIADPYGRKVSAAALDALIVADISPSTVARARRDTDYLTRFTPATCSIPEGTP
ncbi:nitrilase-related carbon-nitrogen hydrolase [Arthrobacter sp. NPDC056691]|uniref:nitrilase-related carbon-nitrogen hydrolase n=1 Tax=unclassified Arthrobacter TaxID=235627 RepID=UPI00367239E4